MTKLERVEREISETEGFTVRIHPNGKTTLPAWPYERAARNAWTVAEWKRQRFGRRYPDITVEVFDAKSKRVTDKATLNRVRASYDSR